MRERFSMTQEEGSWKLEVGSWELERLKVLKTSHIHSRRCEDAPFRRGRSNPGILRPLYVK